MIAISTYVDEIPPLFCQLDILQSNQFGEFICWKEKARWIRFEEKAEQVLGRWSKPHVAAIPQIAMEGLKELLKDAITILNLQIQDNKEISENIFNALEGFLDDEPQVKQKLSELFNLPHIHHHQKIMEKGISQTNLLKIDGPDGVIKERKNSDAFAIVSDFKENIKFKRKVNTKAEGASILIAPVEFVKDCKMIFLRLQAGAMIPSFLEVNVSSRFIVIVVGPLDKQPYLFEIGRAMATCLVDDCSRDYFYSAQTKADLLAAVQHMNRGAVLLPPSAWDPKIFIEPPERYLTKEDRKRAPEITDYIHKLHVHDEESHDDPTLKADKRPFLGLLGDIKRKLSWYISDFTDAFNGQCLAAALYLYLVCLCSLVTFGALLGQNTDNYMATMECILAGALCGALYALFSGQPLNIISATGPMLILEKIIAAMCKKNNIDFLEFRLWIGIWIAVLLLILVLFNLSFLVKYITRFSEDCFASLVAIMFIIDSFKSIFKINIHYPAHMFDAIPTTTNHCTCSYSNETLVNSVDDDLFIIPASTLDECLQAHGEWNCLSFTKKFYPDIFFFSVLLFVFTFLICMILKSFRNSPFFPNFIRSIFSDFAVLIAILTMSGLNTFLKIKTPKLIVPSKLVPTRSDRGWFIPFFDKNPWWTTIAAVVPAIIATLLVFMDQQITAVIVNRKEFKLKKGNGYHLDLLIVAISIAACSMLGLPWFVAATVLALTHVNALRMMSGNSAPGERPTFLGVREQRVTSLIMSILLGLSVFFTKPLSYIPMPVLYAVFLYMGVSALGGLQVTDRTLILFMPPKYQPDHHYLRHVSTRRVHLFTIIQIASTLGMYVVKLIDAIAISFPLLVVATCGVRKLLDYVFTQKELYWLDNLLPSSKKDKKPEDTNCCGSLLSKKFKVCASSEKDDESIDERNGTI